MKIKQTLRRTWGGIVAAVLAVLGSIGLYQSAQTQTPTYTISWTLPTQYTDGSAINATDIASTTVEWRLGAAAWQSKFLQAPVTSTTVPKLQGTTCVRASVTMKDNQQSDTTPEVCVTLAGRPKPPSNLQAQ